MSNKIPCKQCHVMILPSTAERTGGLCMPCKQGNRENIERAKEYYQKQREYDPFRELWMSLVHRVHRTDDGFEGLTDDEKVYFAVSVLDGEVYNGGIHQFFSNSSGDLYVEVVHGLETLQATQTLRLLQQATLLLFGENVPPENRFERYNSMKHYPEDENAPPPEWSIALEHIDQQYYDDPDHLHEVLTEFAERRGLVEPFKTPHKQEG